MGAGSFGLFTFLVTDQFGNPVADSPVATQALPPGMFFVPGFLQGAVFNSNTTNADGFWSAGLGIMDDGTLVTPTIDEFRTQIEPPMGIVFTSGSAAQLYLVDVDMGPYITTSTVNTSELIGRIIDGGLRIQVRRYQREDTFIYLGDVDEDGGHWEDEDYAEVREIVFVDMPLTLSSRRLDGNATRMRNNMPQPIPTTQFWDAEEFKLVDVWQGRTEQFGYLDLPRVHLGGLFGSVNLIVDIGIQDIDYYTDPAPIQDPFPYRTESFEFPQGIVPIFIDPLIIQVDIEDVVPGSDPAAPRKYPGVGLASGIDVGRLGISVNSSEMLSVARTTLDPFPNFASLSYDDTPVVGLALGDDDLRPEKLQLIYFPSSDQLMPGDANTIVLQQFFDDVGHRGEAKNPAEDTDPSDNTVTFEFSY